ncbi:MAG: hypothetical protein HY300_02285 [Verrucomicrobia bacterium]|nr:hypothetical protein [Verrucomicrobiota bacterium]
MFTQFKCGLWLLTITGMSAAARKKTATTMMATSVRVMARVECEIGMIRMAFDGRQWLLRLI